MKLGRFEGTKKEIEDLLIDNGFKIEDYTGKPFKDLCIIGGITLLILFLVFIILITYKVK